MIDKGVNLGIWARAIRRAGLSSLNHKSHNTVLNAIRTLEEVTGGRPGKFVYSIRRQVRSGRFLTNVQLRVLNDYLERKGLARIAVKTYEKGQQAKTGFHKRRAEAAKQFDSICANRPLKPPGQ